MPAHPEPAGRPPIPLIPLIERRAVVRLPQPLTSLHGRAREVEAIGGLLGQETIRLVTLTGPGGVGKTRLAIRVATELAERYADGVGFVPLAPVSDPDLVPAAIAQALEAPEAGRTSVMAALVAYLRDKRFLLVLDNAEHLPDAALLFADLLTAAPRLSLLVTSRARLGLHGEQEFPVKPLATPDPAKAPTPSDLAEFPSVQLFVTRAQALRPGFAVTTANAAAVAGICARLDGLPLALELAAARIAHLPPQALLARLGQSLPLLAGGPRDQPARLQTMRDAIAWSDGLLSPVDKSLFHLLSVFAGGFTLEAAEAVVQCAGVPVPSAFDGIASLIDRSLLEQTADAGDEPRYAMLETIRDYAQEHLAASGGAERARRCHAAYVLDLARSLAARLTDAGMAASLARLSAELPNIRLALAWTLNQGDASVALRVAAALYPFWNLRGHLSEGRRWLEAAMAASPEVANVRIDGMLAIAGLAALQGDNTAAQTHAEGGLALARAHGYPFGEYRAQFLLGIAAEWRGDVDLAASFYRASLAHRDQLGERHWVARSLVSLADAVYLQGDLVQGAALAEEARQVARETGHAWTEGLALGVLAQIAIDQADFRRAIRLCQDTLDVSRALGDRRGIAGVLGTIAGLFLAAGRPRSAVRFLAAARTLASSIDLASIAHYLYYERVLAAARDSLDPEVFASAWRDGLSLPVEQAFAEAFAEAELIAGEAEAATRKSAELSPRELEVLRLLDSGRTNKEIGDALFISHRTVNAHVTHIFDKLGVHSRAEAAVEAVRRGLNPADSPNPSPNR